MKLGTIKSAILTAFLLSAIHLTANDLKDELREDKSRPKAGFSMSGTLGGSSLLGSLDFNYRFLKSHELSLGVSIYPQVTYRNYFLKLREDARLELYGSMGYGYWKPVLYGEYYDSQILAPGLGLQWKDPSHSIALSLEVLHINWVWTENGHEPLIVSARSRRNIPWLGVRAGFNPGNAIRAFKNKS